MKAVVWHGGRDIRIEDVPKPRIKSNEVLVEVRFVGICGSELHAYEGISRRRKPPLVMGHEFSGEIVEVGRDVRDLTEGERVVVDPMTRCGACEPCLRGRENVCQNLRLIGLHTTGAFAEYVSAPAANCYRMPGAMSFEECTLTEPLAVAVHAVNRTPVKLGDTAVIIGAGIIGLMLLQVAKAAGAGRILVADVLDYRLDFAKEIGADFTVNSATEDLAHAVTRIASWQGADVALEAVGLEAAVQQAMNMARIGGKVTVVGMLGKTMTLDIMDAVARELEVKGSYGYTADDFARAFNFIKDSRIDVRPMITDILPLDEAKKGFELLHQKTGKVLKVLLKP